MSLNYTFLHFTALCDYWLVVITFNDLSIVLAYIHNTTLHMYWIQLAVYILRLTRCFFFFELPIQKITYVAWWESKNIIYFLEKHNELYLLMMSPKYFRSASEIFLLLKYLALESVLQIYQKIKMYWTKNCIFYQYGQTLVCMF